MEKLCKQDLMNLTLNDLSVLAKHFNLSLNQGLGSLITELAKKILKTKKGRMPDDLKSLLLKADKAALEGDLKTLQALKRDHNVLPTVYVVEEAAKKGNVDIIRWLAQYVYTDGFYYSPDDTETPRYKKLDVGIIYEAAKHDISILDYLASQNILPETKSDSSRLLTMDLIIENNLDILKWLKGKDLIKADDIPQDAFLPLMNAPDSALYKYLNTGEGLSMIKWLYDTFELRPSQNALDDSSVDEKIIEVYEYFRPFGIVPSKEALRFADPKVREYLEKDDLKSLLLKADKAALEGDLKTLQALKRDHNVLPTVFGIEEALDNDRLDVFKWVAQYIVTDGIYLSPDHTKIKKNKIKTDIIYKAAKKDMSVLDYLASKNILPETKTELSLVSTMDLFIDDELDILRWLKSKNLIKADDIPNDPLVLIMNAPYTALSQFNLPMIKWLHSEFKLSPDQYYLDTLAYDDRIIEVYEYFKPFGIVPSKEALEWSDGKVREYLEKELIKPKKIVARTGRPYFGVQQPRQPVEWGQLVAPH